MATDKLFYYEILALYAIIDLLILYLTFSLVKAENRATLYSIFIFLLAYSIFGLYLFIQELSLHYSGVSSTSINFTNTSGGNIQTLSAWGLMLANLIAIGVYGYSIATGGASSAGGNLKNLAPEPARSFNARGRVTTGGRR